MPLTHRTPGIRPVTPAQAGCAAWYKFNDASTVTDAGSGAISQVLDKSGNNRTLTQPTGGSRPSITAGTINGKAAATFDGGDSLRLGSAFAFGLGACLVMAMIEPNGTGTILGEGSSSTDTPYCQLMHYASQLRTIGRGDAGGATWEITGPAVTTGPQIAVCQIGTTFGLHALNEALQAGTSYTRPTTTVNQMALGCLPRTTESNFYTGKLGEIFVIDDIQNIKRTAALWAYLYEEWISVV